MDFLLSMKRVAELQQQQMTVEGALAFEILPRLKAVERARRFSPAISYSACLAQRGVGSAAAQSNGAGRRLCGQSLP